jgi:hypothetical protein
LGIRLDKLFPQRDEPWCQADDTTLANVGKLVVVFLLAVGVEDGGLQVGVVVTRFKETDLSRTRSCLIQHNQDVKETLL